MNKPTILVVEDDVPVRCLITTTLKTHGYKYLTASNGETAIMMTTSHNPDIMLLDLGLPDIDGIEVIRSVRTWSNLPIIVLSARSEDSDKIEALDNGADDYLTKPFSVDELLARLRVTQRRLNLLASDGINSPVFVNGPLKIDFSAGCVWLSENELHLTPIEYKLLCVLAHNVGKVLTHTSLTQKVWGSTQENDIASLRVYMASLRKKLERYPDAPHLIQTHVGVGYRMLRQPPRGFYGQPSVYLSGGVMEIEHFRRVRTYEEGRLCLEFAGGLFTVYGDGLRIETLAAHRITLRGRFLRTEFSSN